ncbi:MAG: DMT family transporter [Firmicutes bacterium]|nr:DMT family transporter [Candidatus Fermentithermobacillaceae bacterium]
MQQLVADLLLLLITVIWGTTFVIVKEATESIKPFTFLAVRFAIGSATLLLWLVLRRVWRSRARSMVPGGGEDDLKARQASFCSHASEHAPEGAATSSRAAISRSGDRAANRGSGLAADATEGVTGARAGFRGADLLRGAVITGITLFLAYATQTIGLMTVAAGKAAFITGLSVVLVPLGSALLLRVVPETNTTLGVILATIGLGLMSLTLPFNVETGDVLIFLCAIGFAAHILLVGIHSKNGDPAVFAVIQLIIVALGSLVAALFLERPLVVPENTWGAIVYTGIMATALTVLLQSTVQQYTSATHAALIYSAEPVFAAFFGWLMLGEVLSPRETVGAVLILAGMLVSEIGPRKAGQPEEEQTRPF